MPSDDRSLELASKLSALMKKRYGSNSPAMQRRLFDDYDQDRDGKIKAGELQRMLEDAGVGNTFTRGMWVSGVMQRLDSGGDEGISWEEYDKALKEAARP